MSAETHQSRRGLAARDKRIKESKESRKRGERAAMYNFVRGGGVLTLATDEKKKSR